jgi:hypothetical protein
MSLTTWKKEFYLTPAEKVAKKKALDHSIKKWEGLSEANKIRHEVVVRNGAVFGQSGKRWIEIDSTTCSLCYLYLEGGDIGNPCRKCPGTIANGKSCCGSVRSPYAVFFETGNAKPMLGWLMKAKKKETQP